MALCKINQGILKQCTYTAAGVNQLYFTNWSSEIVYTSEIDNPSLITGITLPVGGYFYLVETLTDTVSVGTSVQTGGSPDLKSINHTVVGQFGDVTPEFITSIDAYALGKVIVVAVMKDGSVQLFGAQNGLTSNTFDFNSGTVGTDANGISFDYSGSQPGYQKYVEDISIITNLLPPKGNFISLNIETTSINQEVGLTIEDNSNKQYEINWGDGVINNNYTHIYTDIGKYNITVDTKDKNNEFKKLTSNIDVYINELSSTQLSLPQLFGQYLIGVNIFNLVNINNLDYTFTSCYKLSNISFLSDLDISKFTRLSYVFSNCTSLTDLTPLSKWDVSNITITQNLFSGCTSLTDLTPISNWNVSKIVELNNLFSNCSNLIDISPINNWNLVSLTKTPYIFTNCTSLTDISPISNWNLDNVTNMSYMFNGCINLVTIPELLVSSAQFFTNTFNNCVKLENFSGLKNITSGTINLTSTNVLTKESVLNIFENIDNGVGEIILSTETYNLLTPEDIEIATNKGWIISNS